MTVPRQAERAAPDVAALRARMLHYLAKYERAKAEVERMEARALRRVQGEDRPVDGRRLPAAVHVAKDLQDDFTYAGLVADYRSAQRTAMLYAVVLIALRQSGGAG